MGRKAADGKTEDAKAQETKPGESGSEPAGLEGNASNYEETKPGDAGQRATDQGDGGGNEPAKEPAKPELRTDGPTIEDFVKSGRYQASQYPPEGFAEVDSPGLQRFKATGSIDPVPAMAGRDVEPERATLVPGEVGSDSNAAKELLLDACEKYGINPTRECRPLELKSWKFYQGSDLDNRPDAVVLVTHGGVKLKHYADPGYPPDQDTDETLARLFQAFKTDPKTKEVTRVPLPTDLALPIQAVTGQVTRTEHRFRRGYLRSGGKQESDRRETQAKK